MVVTNFWPCFEVSLKCPKHYKYTLYRRERVEIGMGNAMNNMAVLFWDGWFYFWMNVKLIRTG